MEQELNPLPVNIHNFGDLRLAQSWRVNPEALQQRIEAQQQALLSQQEQLQSLPPIALDCNDFTQIRARRGFGRQERAPTAIAQPVQGLPVPPLRLWHQHHHVDA